MYLIYLKPGYFGLKGCTVTLRCDQRPLSHTCRWTSSCSSASCGPACPPGRWTAPDSFRRSGCQGYLYNLIIILLLTIPFTNSKSSYGTPPIELIRSSWKYQQSWGGETARQVGMNGALLGRHTDNSLVKRDCLTKTNPYVAIHCSKALSLKGVSHEN